MSVEKQVVSLELAKEMEKLGFKQESLWYWVRVDLEFKLSNNKYYKHITSDPNEHYSAYTVAELGEMLPSYIKPPLPCYDIERIKTERNGGHYICYFKEIQTYNNGTIQMIREFSEQTEANARAKMLIYLERKGLLCP
jgi:hypothetical protein